MTRPSVLSLLVQRCHHGLRFYDPATTCLALYALGQLQPRGLRAPALLRQLVPSLPAYTPVQLIGLMEGLSMLRVSHQVTTAHFLRLFLLALREGDATAAAAEVAAVAGMARVLQRHHTPRTVRAFLAAVDRALVKSGEEEEDSTEDVDGSRGTGGAARQTATPAASMQERQTAMQLLFLAEVYINAGICVAEPHTPRWLLRMLRRTPPNAFALRTLLHLHGRLLAPECEGPSSQLSEKDAELMALLAAHSAFVLHCLSPSVATAEASGDGGERKGQPWGGEERASSPHPRAASRAGEHEKGGGDRCWGETLSAAERHAVLRCIVLHHLDQCSPQSLAASVTRVAHLMWRCGCVTSSDASLLSLSVSFHRLTRQHCWELCGASWRWWLQVLTTPDGAAWVVRESASPRTLASSAVRRAAVLQSTALLQLLHGSYTRHKCRAGMSAGSDDASTEPGEKANTVEHAVRLLCHTLAVLCDDGLPPHPRHSGDEEWVLLSLLLSAECATRQRGGGVGFVQWIESQLMKAAAEESGARLVASFERARHGVSYCFMAAWCEHWSGGAAGAATHLAFRFQAQSPSESGSAMCLHWTIAAALDALARAPSDSGHAAGDGWCGRLNLAELPLGRVWQAFTAATAATLSSVPHQPDVSQNSWDLELHLLHVVTAYLSNPLRAGCTRAPSLWTAFFHSTVPDLLCVALQHFVEQTGCAVFFSPSTTGPPTAQPRRCSAPASMSAANGYAEKDAMGSAVADYQGVRVWWAQSCRYPPLPPTLAAQDALRTLLRLGLARTASLPFSQRLLPPLLSACLQSTPLRVSEAPAEGESKGTCTSAAAAMEEGRRRCVVASASWHIVDGVMTHTASSIAARRDAITTAIAAHDAPLDWCAFATASGLAETVMANVEAFCHRSGRRRCDSLYSTLKVHESGDGDGDGDDGGDCGGSAQRFVAPLLQRAEVSLSSWTAQHRAWYRDAQMISLTASRRPHSSSATAAAGEVKISRVREEGDLAKEAQHGGTAASNAAMRAPLLLDFLGRVEMATAATDVLGALSTTEQLNYSRCRNSSDGGGDGGGVPAPAASSALVNIRRVIWRDCCVVLQHLSCTGNGTLHEAGREVEEAVLRCFVRWRDDGSDTSQTPSPPFTQRTHAPFATTTPCGGDMDLLILPHVWLALHTACPSAAAPDAVLLLWRLQVFAEAWWHCLPRTSESAPSQRRLLACLQASLFSALSRAAREGDERLTRWVLQSMRELGTSVCRSTVEEPVLSFLNPEMSPFRCLGERVEKMAQAVLQRSLLTEAAGGDFAIAAPPTVPLGRLQFLSPIEIYLTVLLPLHPFLSCAHTFAAGTSTMPETQLVAVTWAHVLVIQALRAHHPRVHVRYVRVSHQPVGSTQVSEEVPPLPTEQLHAAQRALCNLELQLLNGGGHVEAGGGADSAAAHRWLQWRCLAGELRAALAGLAVTLTDAPPQPHYPP